MGTLRAGVSPAERPDERACTFYDYQSPNVPLNLHHTLRDSDITCDPPLTLPAHMKGLGNGPHSASKEIALPLFSLSQELSFWLFISEGCDRPAFSPFIVRLLKEAM